MKKVLAIILSLVTIVTTIPFMAFAQSTENADENGQMTTTTTATGNNSVGTYLAETFEEAQAENQENTSDLAGMSYLSFDGKTATVEFATQVDTQLVVAIYSEDGTKMLASGVKNVTTEDRKVTVDIASATLPEYYLVKAFLLDANNHSALCGEFIDDTHTKAYQDFEALDIYDFDADKVINLDSNPDNNFLVVADGAIEIFGNESTNTFVSADYDAGEYVFENIADDIKSLKVGDVFYYQSNEKYEVIKVKSIAVNGTKATVIADSMDIEEAFEAIKINSSEFEDNTTSVSRSAKARDTDYTVEDDFVNGTFTVKLGKDEKGNIKPVITKDFTVGDEENPETDEEKDYNDSDFKFVAEATGSAKMTAKLVVYIKDDYKKVEFTVTGSVGLEIKVGIEFDKTFKLGDFFFTFYKIITIGVEIKFHFNIQVILTISGTIEFSKGFKWSSASNKFTEISEPCKLKPEVKIEGEIYIGLILAPYVNVVSKNIFFVTFPIEVGASVSAELSSTVSGDENHSCNACLDGDIDVKLEAQAKVYIARKIDWLEKTYSSPKFEIEWHVADFYYSITYSEFGWGECPYIINKIKFGKCGDDLNWEFDEEKGILYIDGTGDMYDYDYDNRPWEAYEGSIKQVIIGDGVTNIGNYAFYNCPSLTSITIPDSVTSIGMGAFSGCTNLESIKIPNNVTTIESTAFGNCTKLSSVDLPTNWDTNISIYSSGYFSPFYGCNNLTEIIIPEGATTIPVSAFDNCTSLESITIPSSVKSICEDAFYNCTSLRDVYYTGTEEQWKKISIGNYNDYLTNATIHYNYNGTSTKSTFSLTENVPVTYSLAPVQVDVDTDAISFAYGYCIADNKYVVLNVINYGDNFELTTDNLLYIDVVTADENGNVNKSFEPIYYDNQSTTLLIGDFGNGVETKIIKLAEHTCSFDTFVEYDTTHPHCAVYKCSCGATNVTTETGNLDNCEICNPPAPEYNYTFSIHTPSRTEIRCKDGIILHANLNGTYPEDTRIEWTSSNGNFDKSVVDGNSLKIISKDKGYTTFTARLYDAEGNVLATDSVEMYSKAGFFDKIGGFFRNLFGTTKVYDN